MSASLTDYVNYLQPSFVEWEVLLEVKESRGKTNLQENWKRTDWVVELADDEIVSRNSHQQSQSMLSKISNLEEKLRKSQTMLQDATKKLELIQQSTKKTVTISC